MRNLKYLFLLLFYFISNSIICQDIKYYNMYMSVVTLPTCYGQKEIYQKNDSLLIHEIHEKDNKCNVKVISLNEKENNIENLILKLDSLLKLNKFVFTVNKTFIDTLKSRNIEKEKFHISNQEIDSFFIRGDTIIINLSDIKKENNEFRTDDGIDYYLKLEYKINKDTIIYKFNGDLDDFSATNNVVRYWIPFYLVYKEYNLFRHVKYVDEYFSDKNLESIIWMIIVNNR